MNTFRAFLGLIVGVVLLSPARAVEFDNGTPWSAGASSIDITPEAPVWMAGYAARKAPSNGVLLPIRAKALAIRDGQGHTLVWITADLIGFDRALSDLVKRRLHDEDGIPEESIALFASHTHTGPIAKYLDKTMNAYGIDPNSDEAKNNGRFRHDLEEKLVRVAHDAISALKPATASFGLGEAGFAINRREKTANGFKIGLNPDGPTDRSLPVLRVEDARGNLLAVVFGYACHNTTLGADMLKLSGDYAGFAQAEIEKAHPGAVALFITGCAGDANPNPRGTVDLAREHGHALAEAVESTLNGPLTALSGTIRAASAEPTIRFAGPTDRASYEQRLQEPGSGRQAHAKRMLAALDAHEPIRSSYPYPIQAFAIGDQLTMVALAGEVVADYALRLKRELGGDDRPALWVAAYANDVFGYVGSARVIREGGYEGLEAYYYSTFPTPLSEEVETTIVTAAHELVNRVRHP